MLKIDVDALNLLFDFFFFLFFNSWLLLSVRVNGTHYCTYYIMTRGNFQDWVRYDITLSVSERAGVEGNRPTFPSCHVTRSRTRSTIIPIDV